MNHPVESQTFDDNHEDYYHDSHQDDNGDDDGIYYRPAPTTFQDTQLFLPLSLSLSLSLLLDLTFLRFGFNIVVDADVVLVAALIVRIAGYGETKQTKTFSLFWSSMRNKQT